jgi:hypothetical protein
MAKGLRHLELTAVYRKVPEGYIGFIEELPGANTQGRTLEEARANLREAASWFLRRTARAPGRTLTRTASFVSRFGSLRGEAQGACPTSRAAWLPSVARRQQSCPVPRSGRGKVPTVPRHREINEYLCWEDLSRPGRARALSVGP